MWAIGSIKEDYLGYVASYPAVVGARRDANKLQMSSRLTLLPNGPSNWIISGQETKLEPGSVPSDTSVTKAQCRDITLLPWRTWLAEAGPGVGFGALLLIRYGITGNNSSLPCIGLVKCRIVTQNPISTWSWPRPVLAVIWADAKRTKLSCFAVCEIKTQCDRNRTRQQHLTQEPRSASRLRKRGLYPASPQRSPASDARPRLRFLQP